MKISKFFNILRFRSLFVIPFLSVVILFSYIFAFTCSSSAFDTADIKFEVKKNNYGNQFTLRIQEGYRTLLDYSLSSLTDSFTDRGCTLKKVTEGYHLSYRGGDHSALDLIITDQGDIYFYLLNDTLYHPHDTRYAFYKSWGFKTDGKVINQRDSAFYKLFIHAKETHNYGVLKAYTGEFLQNYLFNRGIIHFGDESAYAGLNVYSSYTDILDKLNLTRNPKLSFQHGIIDDYGAIIAEKGLKITNLTHKARGIVHVNQELKLYNGGIDNDQQYIVTGPITGTAHTLTNHRFLHVDIVNPHNFTLNNFTNTGSVFVKNSSSIIPTQTFDNKGRVFGSSSLKVGAGKKIANIGNVISDSDIEVMIAEAMSEAERNHVYQNWGVFSASKKIIVNKHTDHYLNTITSHYLVDEHGRRTFTHKTETGDVFQRRTTEREEAEDCSEVPVPLAQSQIVASQQANVFKKFLDNLKQKIKKFAQAHGNSRAVLNALAKALKAVGLSDDELAELFSDEQINHALKVASLYDELTEEGQSDFLKDYADYGQYVHSTSIQAQRLGLSTAQWIQQHGLEFLNHACDLFIAGSRLTKHPFITVPAAACSLNKISPKVVKYLEKAQVYLNKQHDGGASKGGDLSSGSYKSSPSSTQSVENPGRIQTRINIRIGEGTNKTPGLDSAWNKHGNVNKPNKSQFTISKEELVTILQDKKVVQSPVRLDVETGSYVREVDIGRIIGKLPNKIGFEKTSNLTILTDRFGNLVNTYPGKFSY